MMALKATGKKLHSHWRSSPDLSEVLTVLTCKGLSRLDSSCCSLEHNPKMTLAPTGTSWRMPSHWLAGDTHSHCNLGHIVERRMAPSGTNQAAQCKAPLGETGYFGASSCQSFELWQQLFAKPLNQELDPPSGRIAFPKLSPKDFPPSKFFTSGLIPENSGKGPGGGMTCYLNRWITMRKGPHQWTQRVGNPPPRCDPGTPKALVKSCPSRHVATCMNQIRFVMVCEMATP